MLENNWKDVIHFVSTKIVNPKSKKRFSEECIKTALKSVNFNVVHNKLGKVQGLDAIKQLEKYYVVERTGNLVKVKFSKEGLLEQLREELSFEVFERKGNNEFLLLVSSKIYKAFEKHLQEKYSKDYKLTIIETGYFLKDTQNIDDKIEVELEVRPEVVLPSDKNKKSGKNVKEEKKEISQQIGFTFQNQKKSKKAKVCSTCLKSTFEDIKLYKEHIKSVWHKFNLKRKMKGEDPLSKEDYDDYKTLEEMM